jgi:hypothetical protein
MLRDLSRKLTHAHTRACMIVHVALQALTGHAIHPDHRAMHITVEHTGKRACTKGAFNNQLCARGSMPACLHVRDQASSGHPSTKEAEMHTGCPSPSSRQPWTGSNGAVLSGPPLTAHTKPCHLLLPLRMTPQHQRQLTPSWEQWADPCKAQLDACVCTCRTPRCNFQPFVLSCCKYFRRACAYPGWRDYDTILRTMVVQYAVFKWA